MATVNKDFKIKSGLIVEGTNATVNGYDVLKKSSADETYIINLIGGTATSANTANTVVKRDSNGDFSAGIITADLVGDVTGTVSDISNHDTGDLSEGSNLYFTSARAVTANEGLWDTEGSAAAAQSAAEAFATSADSTLYSTVTTNIATAKSEAISTAAADATDKADAAQSAAESYTDDAITQEVLDRNSAISSAISTEVTNRNTAINTAITNLDLAGTYDALGAADTALTDAKAYTDQEVAALVDGAPTLLDTLNELAAAIADNPNYATDVANLVASKADTTYVNDQDTAIDTAAQGYASTAESNAISSANSYTDGKISTEVSDRNSAISSAISTEVTNRNSAISSAIADEVIDRNDAIDTAINALSTTDIEEGSNLYFTNQRAIDAVGGTVTGAIDALTTSDIEEGSNLYFTSSRAEQAAIDVLLNATKDNIQITGSYTNGITITAENGVADSTTDDLDEGSANLYFTSQRAVDALEAVVPNFTAVEVNSVAKQVASTLSAPTAGIQTGFAWAKTDYRSAEFLVKVAYGSHTEISKVLITLDTSDNIAITEYGIVGTNGSASTISAGISGSNVELIITTVNNNSTITVYGTLLA